MSPAHNIFGSRSTEMLSKLGVENCVLHIVDFRGREREANTRSFLIPWCEECEANDVAQFISR
jgi:hypothetical protein